MITKEYLRSVLDYNILTGKWTLLVDSGKKKKGESAESTSHYGYSIVTLPGKRGCFGGGQFKSHRLAFIFVLDRWPFDEVDHINGEKLDNSWINLRDVTSSINKRNIPLRKDNTSGSVGVSYHKKRKQWRARIFNRHLGWFKSKEEAIQSRLLDVDSHLFSERHGK